MLIHRTNKYGSEPTPYQAQATGQWVGATRFVFNTGRRLSDADQFDADS
jgi:hypothetical protein